MIQSRCGLLCDQCHYRRQGGCKGCLNITRPFWAESCPIKDCCREQAIAHCGECPGFPCEKLMMFAYDQEHGDNGQRMEQCKKWRRAGAL